MQSPPPRDTSASQSPIGSDSPTSADLGSAPSPLDPATRPSLGASSAAMSQASVAVQPPATPQSVLSTSTPTATPVPNVTTGPVVAGITPPHSVSPPAPVGGNTPAVHPGEELDPAVAMLKSMFPDFDDAVLQSILEACDGDQDRAVEMLLGMSDPDYVAQPSPPARQPTQLELDEELARRLYLEDREADLHATPPPPRPSQQQYQQVPYQPRQSHPHQYQYQSQESYYAQQAASGGGGSGAGLSIANAANELKERFSSLISGPPQSAPRSAARSGYYHPGVDHSGSPPQQGAGSEIQDQFNKFAETGRRTFNSIYSKVRAKIQEFENPHGAPDSQQQQAQGGHWSSWQHNPGPAPQQGGHYGPQSPQQAQPAAFSFREEPAFPATADPSRPLIAPQPQQPIPPAALSASRTEYYSPSPRASSPNTAVAPVAPSSNNAAAPKPALSAPQTEPTGDTTTPRASFDASRLGLKPKRPVSFVDTSNTANAQQRKPRDHDEESLEYVSSPFDDR